MEQLLSDLRLAVRNLSRRRKLAAVIVVTLAMGIACTTAMFSVVQGVLLRPLPWPDSDRLAVIWNVPPRSTDEVGVSDPEVTDLQELLENVRVGAYTVRSSTAFLDDRTETLAVTWATAEVFDILGASPVLGRAFSTEEYGPEGPPTVMLSFETWQRLYGADPGVLGRKINVDGTELEIIGVMPRDFPMPLDYLWGERTQLWTGLELGEPGRQRPRQVRMSQALARIDGGTSLENARAELDRAMAELSRRHPEHYEAGWRMRLTPVEVEVLGGVRPALLALFGAVFFVLMIACANVAHLLLAEIDTRRNELAVRGALGARRGQLLRQLMIENLALAVAGGALGAFGAYWAVDALLLLKPANLPRMDTVSVDLTVLSFGLGASVVTALGFGLLPAWKAAGTDIRSTLQGGRGTVGGLRGQGGRKLLMAAEVALATVLLAGAGLLIETLRNLARADLGFEPRGLVAAGLRLPRDVPREPEDILRFWDRALESARRVPGVESASLNTMVPFFTGSLSRPVEVERGAGAGRQLPRVTIDRAGPGIAAAMGFELLRGRDLEESDREGSVLVGLVNETLAQYLEGTGVGERLRLSDRPWITVVGVIRDVRHGSLDEPAAPWLVLPYHQLVAAADWRIPGFMWLEMRTRGATAPVIEAARDTFRRLEAETPLVKVLVMEDLVADSALSRYRFAAFVLSLFAAVALGLAVVGIYGLLSYLVNRGRREVGVRMALGARRGDILNQVSRQGMSLALAGLAVGIPAALALSSLIESLLYGVAPTDPGALLATALVLLTVASAASYLPARRATEVNPIEVLRSE